MTEPLTKNKQLLLFAMAIIGTILLPIFCILFVNSIIVNFESLQSLSVAKSMSAMEYSKLMFVTCGMIMAIVLSGILGLTSWVVIFIEFGYDKKYANYLSLIPVIGGIICIAGLNAFPNSLTGCILFSVGGAVLLTGVAGKMGLFGKHPSANEIK
jgi:hypothetical protein